MSILAVPKRTQSDLTHPGGRGPGRRAALGGGAVTMGMITGAPAT